MINFVYSGEIVFRKCPFQVIQILKFAKQYCVEDLEETSEDDIVKKLDTQNIVKMLISLEKEVTVTEEINYRVRTLFLRTLRPYHRTSQILKIRSQPVL